MLSTENTWIPILLFLAIVLVFSVYVLSSGIRLYQLSSFRFYLATSIIRCITTLLTGAVFLGISFSASTKPTQVQLIIPVIGFGFAAILEAQQETKLRQSASADWNAFADNVAQARQCKFLDKIILPNVRRTEWWTKTHPSYPPTQNLVELLARFSSAFPAFGWLLLTASIVMLGIAFANPNHPNPYIIPTIGLAGIGGVTISIEFLLAANHPRIARILMFVHSVLFLAIIYLIFRTFTYVQ